MSVDNSELLMLLGGKKSKSTIGKAGQKGFGVGVYGGDPADLTAMGLAPMEGCENPSSDNYGNYIHTNGSVMVFIPAFCYRIGNKSAPSYRRCALEIRDASEGEGDGWILHRSFIDGGVQKSGFFIDKYICSYAPSPVNDVVSVKNGDNIRMDEVLMGIPGTKGKISDAILLGRLRGVHYSCVTCFQWSALAMLSLAHGQAATSNQFCGWYDANHKTNYPKGNNNNGSLGDTDDPSVKWTAHGKVSYLGKTGSGSPFNKTTHNGQNCGVTDVNGSQWQVTIGFVARKTRTLMVMKEATKAHDITVDNYSDTSLNDTGGTISGYTPIPWGDIAFFTAENGVNRALCGIMPQVKRDPLALFGYDVCDMNTYSTGLLVVGGDYNGKTDAGVWARLTLMVEGSAFNFSFRISGYAN